ncbi:hypothetical protein VQ042_16585 [Aurantimonas sp. A2-1-M11]|uniref:hypothetical protein n=1 Tax=Aurantimonas sp. A2-1-M11 TaxID=3113712 RepID=UPI002F937D23
MSDRINSLRICSYCPNPCRGAVPETSDSHLETLLPSALSYLAVAVEEGYVRADPDVVAKLSETRVAELCRPACVYGYDIPAELRTFLAALETVDA